MKTENPTHKPRATAVSVSPNSAGLPTVAMTSTNGGFHRPLLGLIFATILIQVLLRLWLSIDMLLRPTIDKQLGAMVHWRVYDGFIGWIGLLILSAYDDAKSRSATVMRYALGIGIVGFTITLFLGDVSSRAIVEIIGASLLALAATLVAGRQIMYLMRSIATGLTIDQLWRVLALQWLLVWVGAEVALRIRFWRDGVQSIETARSLLFLIPALGFVPAVLCSLGIRWWSTIQQLQKLPRPRVRAWIVSLLTINLGAMLLIAGAVWKPWPMLIGVSIFAVGIILYLLGFPPGAWSVRATRSWLPILSWIVCVLAVGMIAAEAVMRMNSTIIPDLFSASWRQLLSSIEVLWLLGLGVLAIGQVPSLYKTIRPPVQIAQSLLLLGALGTSTILWIAAYSHDSIQLLFIGVVLEAAALVVAGLVMLRIRRYL